jgi:hypothetical protein
MTALAPPSATQYHFPLSQTQHTESQILGCIMGAQDIQHQHEFISDLGSEHISVKATICGSALPKPL